MRDRTAALTAPPASAPAAAPERSDWATIRKLLPYLWRYRWRVGLALGFMLAAKFSNVGVPLLLKSLVDSLAIKPGSAESMLVLPLGLLIAYGGLRLATSLFTELRELIFAKVDMVLGTDVTVPLSVEVFRRMGAKKVFDPSSYTIGIVNQRIPSDREVRGE